MPSRVERLADHFIKSAGIAAVYVDAGGAIVAADTAGMFSPPGRKGALLSILTDRMLDSAARNSLEFSFCR